MADVEQKLRKQKSGVQRSKKSSLRVDLTPMVDLGFLLISFFVFTTTIAQPKAMKLAMPDDSNKIDSSSVPADKTLSLLLASTNKVYAYSGLGLNNIKDIGSDSKALRELILNKKMELDHKAGNNSGIIVLIKPTEQSTYKNVVDALDEMLICNIKTYILMDANSYETEAVKQLTARQ